MGDELEVPWPASPIVTTRLIVRPTESRDRPGCVELLCSSNARRYLGGSLERPRVESEMPEVPMDHPGHFAVEEDGRFLGTVMVDRRPRSRPGHLSPGGNELEVSYTFLSEAWGHGHADEAVASVLGWISTVLPDEPVVLCTQRPDRLAPDAESSRLLAVEGSVLAVGRHPSVVTQGSAESVRGTGRAPDGEFDVLVDLTCE
jgi:hypothetical protein